MNRNNQVGKKLLIIIFAILVVAFIFGTGYLVGGTVSTINHRKDADTDSVPADLQTLDQVKDTLLNKFYYGENTKEYDLSLIDDAIRGMVEAQGDPYTEYMNAEEVNEFLSSLQSNFVGIGVQYTQLDEGLLVIRVLDNSPALEAGVQAGDIIVGVDGKSITEIPSADIQDMIRGEEGTKVVITVLRGADSLDITITRGTISSTVNSEIRGTVGIMYISSFSDQTGTEVKTHLDKLKKAGATQLIIDLRDNGGGYVVTLDEMCSYFMNNGDIVMREYDRNGNETIDRVTNSNKYKFDKIVILTNGNSASCSEVFAQAMKENVGAVIVGETTYGKGVAQVTSWLDNGGAIKYTDVIWASGKGVNIGGVGITPDYEVRLHDVLYEPYLTLEDNEVLVYDSVDTTKVRNVQLMLDFLGYQVDRLDGYFDASTRDAVTAFQSAIGLEATGEVNQQTASCLNSAVVRAWSLEKETYDLQMLKALEVVAE